MALGLRKRQRLVLVLVMLTLGGASAALVLAALQEKVAFFLSPSELAAREITPGKRLRVGGLVVEGSIERAPDGEVRFALTDTAHDVRVAYRGLLPDLFREGQGIVALGTVRSDGTFQASEVLAKHDENYMPKEVADALKQAGRWQETGNDGARSNAGAIGSTPPAGAASNAVSTDSGVAR